MKLILNNSKLIFAKSIPELVIDIQAVVGYMWYWGSPTARETIEWAQYPSSSNSKYQKSQVIDVDRNKYSKFLIEVPSDVSHIPTHFWFAYAGLNKGQILYQASSAAETRIKPNVEYSFANTNISIGGVSATLDAQLNRITGVSDEITRQIAFSLKGPNSDSTSEPWMENADFARIKIHLIP